MTLSEFHNAARQIVTAHGFGSKGFSVTAQIMEYAHSLGVDSYSYSCTAWIPACAVTGYHDSIEKALTKLELICREAKIAKMGGGDHVGEVEAPSEQPDPIGYSIGDEMVNFVVDGDQIMASLPGFENISESECGFGSTELEAASALATALGKQVDPVYVLHTPSPEQQPVHMCQYSKAMNQPFPRLCIDCGKPEERV